MKSTYLKSVFGILILLFTSFSGCEKEKLIATACGIDNPDRNIPWLANRLYSIAAVALPEIQKVDLYEYRSEELIRIVWENDYQLYDAPYGSIYDCEGNLLYSCGGNQPIDSCSIVINKSQYIGIIWEKE